MTKKFNRFLSHELPDEEKEFLVEKPGATMALQVDALHGKPIFAIQNIATGGGTDLKAIESWAEKQIDSGYQLVFVLKHNGWHLLATDSDFKFSQAQINSFFSQPLLQDLWISHHPVASVRKRYIETLKGRGLN